MSTSFKASAVRIAFLTDSAFDKQDKAKLGALKKRALRVMMQKLRAYCVEDSNNPDVVFEVRRLAGSKSWCLHKRSYNV